jgi:hypothetical protein
MSKEQQSPEEDLGFTLNNKNYNYADLDEGQQELVQQLKDIQMQLDRIEFQHRQVSGSKQHFTDQLVKSVEPTPSEPASEPALEQESS